MRYLSTAISILAAAPLAAQTSRPGKTVFENQCAACHGADANGGEFAPAIITRLPTRSDTEIRNVVRDGLLNRGMPAVKMSEP